ncbi:hypothetical protein [Iamia sp.]|uniref:hypothetical protein n=1 Tax=Iamia sp. TaxID=2722710 RepID=UPI002C2FD49B|nr:hypothetical protein [Iamia sp.]HXH59516.1 hypothetical protein [Iamia sp.]
MDALGTFLLVVLAMGLVSFLIVRAAVLLGARALARRNRVSPTLASPAPLTWLGQPGAAARLHRRLRAAVAVARAASASAPSAERLADLSAELEQEAVAIDSHLVVISHLTGKDRRLRLAPLALQVQRVEQVASQISLHAAQSQAPLRADGQRSTLDDLAHQLEVLEEARTEVTDIEAAAGVRRVSPYAVPDRLADPRAQPGG